MTAETFRTSSARFSAGDLVVSTKALRQDGTYPDPDIAVGEVLVPAGMPGQVMDVGVYLNEHIVYAVAFAGGRLVGCLDRELAPLPTDDGPDEPAALAGTAPATSPPTPDKR